MTIARDEREKAIQFGQSALDGVLFDVEYIPNSAPELRDGLQKR